jgi:hypothetical protein
MMWTLGSVLLSVGGIMLTAGSLFSALIIRSEYRRGEIGILAGTARFGVFTVVLGLLLCMAGSVLGGWHDFIKLLSTLIQHTCQWRGR